MWPIRNFSIPGTAVGGIKREIQKENSKLFPFVLICVEKRYLKTTCTMVVIITLQQI